MAVVSRDVFNEKLLRLLEFIDGESPEFDQFDRLLGGPAAEGITPVMLAINEHLDEQIGPVFDALPRSAALMACFMYGVILGQKLTRFGVTGVSA